MLRRSAPRSGLPRNGSTRVVYRAVDRLHREMQDRDPYVAIKILNANLKRHPSALIALQRETRKARLLAHENIINVHSFDRDGSVVYMTMERLDGKSLRSIPRRHDTCLRKPSNARRRGADTLDYSRAAACRSSGKVAERSSPTTWMTR